MHSSDFRSTDTKTVDELWIKFKDTVLHSMRSHIPHKLTRTRCDLPWLTSDIRKQIKKHNKLYRQYKTSRSPEICSRFLQLKFDIQRQMRQSHNAYISRLITDPEDGTSFINPKRFWSFIKKLRKDSNGIQPLKVDGNIITDSKEKANVFNSHFRSVFTNEPDKVLPDKGPSPHPLMEDITITTPGILTLLQNLNIHKASGPDTISTRLLKETAEVTAPILKLIFEKSLATGGVPYDWRIANVTPVYNKAERCVPQNYQPISLTSTCSKVLEHIISSHLKKHLENNLLYEFQHGFQHNRSCETQLVSFINDLAKSYDNGKQTDVIFMDITKAFDTVPHKRLRFNNGSHCF